MRNDKNKFGARFIKTIFHNRESFTKYWEEQRKKGILYFFAVNTIWAVFGFVTACFISLNARDNYLGWERGEALPAAIIIGFIAGILSASLKWLVNEAKYYQIENDLD